MAEFVVRLHHQAAACDFSNVDEQIRDQVIEKCRSNKVRTKLLEKGHGLTLQQLQTIAATIEMTESQTKHMAEGSSSTSGRETVASVKAGMPRGRPGRGGNALSRHPSGVRGPNTTNRGGRRTGESSSGHDGHQGFSDASVTASQQGPAGRCFCCGYEGHYAKDKSCPARGKECTKCGRMGNFSACCKTKMDPHGWNSNKKGTVSNVEYEEQQDGEYDLYSFSVLNTVSPAEETKVRVVVDKQEIDMIVDSGATVNIVDHETWERLEVNRIRCKSEKTNKRLYAYGSVHPLDLRGKFTTNVSLSGPHTQKRAQRQNSLF